MIQKSMTVCELNDEWIVKLSSAVPGAGRFVTGEGRVEGPRLMMIGEAPGEQEELQGRPFVGKAGKNLDGFLAFIGIPREEIYITNAVKLRPTRVSDRGRKSNRPPTLKEQSLFVPWLKSEIEIVRPRLIVTLGNTSLRAVIGREAAIGACHGKLMSGPMGGAVFALYHPAAVIYDRSLAEIYRQDLIALKSLLSETT